MNKDEIIETMVDEVRKIEREAINEKFTSDRDLKKDAVSKIYKKLQEVTPNEN